MQKQTYEKKFEQNDWMSNNSQTYFSQTVLGEHPYLWALSSSLLNPTQATSYLQKNYMSILWHFLYFNTVLLFFLIEIVNKYSMNTKQKSFCHWRDVWNQKRGYFN